MGLGTVGDLALVVLGFSLIIFIHELGHFVAARWAGIRVLAFALGFGPAVVSYRKGLGVRRGSSEGEYRRLVKEDGAGASGVGGLGAGSPGAYLHKTAGISPTEYRLNFLPLGGYVKMLGQDDSDPGAVSAEADSFTSAPVYKRMVVISAGVAMNIVTAAILFVIVFSVGLKTEPARVGFVAPGSAATTAVAMVDGKEVKGLQSGDTVLKVDGESIEAFKDISLAVAMSRNGKPIDVVVRRAGVDEPLTFTAKPTVDPGSRMLALGIGPAFSGRIGQVPEKDRAAVASRFAGLGAAGVEPGMTLVDAAGKELDFDALSSAAAASGGKPFVTRWRAPAETATQGRVVEVALTPAMNLQVATVERDGVENTVEHLAGLTPLLGVRAVVADSHADKAGVKAGDVFVRLGDVQWPSYDEGLRQIKAPARQSIRTSVLRGGKVIDLGDITVSGGRIGIELMTTAETSNHVTRFPHGKVTVGGKVRTAPFAAAVGEVPPGSRVVRVGEIETPTLREVRAAVLALVAAGGGGQSKIPLTLAVPGPADSADATGQVVLSLEEADAKVVAGLGWESPLPYQFFDPVEIEIKRSSPIAAVGKGMEETKKMVLTTYLTFARLFQGSVKVEHLKGPIGIADVGTRLAGKGWVWLLFFMAAVSVNLAVVNFLPLPIVDGGHFCFLLWEQFTGRPVSAAVQNVAALAGLALIGAVFLMTTYNDLANLLWR